MDAKALRGEVPFFRVSMDDDLIEDCVRRDDHIALVEAKDVEIAHLTAELTALRAGQDALVAAAYEAAAHWLMTVPENLPSRDHYAKHIRRLPPADATAALNAMLRDARTAALREAVAGFYAQAANRTLFTAREIEIALRAMIEKDTDQ